MDKHHLLDRFLCEIDNGLRTLFPPADRVSSRITPAFTIPEETLSPQEKKHIAGLMRINHAGEVCAQALYQGQALTAKLHHVRQQMQEAASEETDHLAWCEKRLAELGEKSSMLNPFWYLNSLLLGALAGLAGDKISLGFVVETEVQVTAHLKRHLTLLPKQDKKTKAILERMQEDEEHHAAMAIQAGAAPLPSFIKTLMHLSAKLMIKSSYYL